MSIMKDDSLQQQIHEQLLTRELLKRKLQTRQSPQPLVDVDIISSSFSKEHKQLQMRKTQDILKKKILSRSNRQLLIEQNISSNTTAAPSIQKTSYQLKPTRLVDKLSVRPGILDSVANNISEIDSNLYSKSKRSLSKLKSCLTFHEYKGPLKKVEVTKVSFHSTLKPFEHNDYRNQLKQQQLFLELVQNKDKTIKNRLQLLQSFKTMKLVDSKNAHIKMSSKTINNEEQHQKLIELEKLRQNTIAPSTPESIAYATNNDVISNLLDENTDSISSSTYMDWITVPSPIIIDNNLDLTQFDTDHHHLFFD